MNGKDGDDSVAIASCCGDDDEDGCLEGAAVGIAVAMQPAFRQRGLERIGVVLCGGNLDLDALPSLLAGA